MRSIKATATAATALLVLTACSGSGGPDLATCKKDLTKQFDNTASNGLPGNPPASCSGVDSETLERLTQEIVSDKLAHSRDGLKQDRDGAATP
jgi:hypothetical protein